MSTSLPSSRRDSSPGALGSQATNPAPETNPQPTAAPGASLPPVPSATIGVIADNLEARMSRLESMFMRLEVLLQTAHVPAPVPAPAPAPATVVSSSHPIKVSSQDPKLPKIQPYSGKEAELEAWLSQTGKICALTNGVRLEDSSCVKYARLHLSGNALAVFDSKCLELQHNPQYADSWEIAGCRNWQDFETLLRLHLGPPNPDITGRQALRALKQKGAVAPYTQSFLAILRTFKTPMLDLDKREAYIAGLKPKVMEHVRGHLPSTATLQDAIITATTWDKTMWHMSHKPSGDTPSASKPGHTPMDLGALQASLANIEARMDKLAAVNTKSAGSGRVPKLSPEERERCIQEHLCFRCRKPGHSASNCPQNRTKN